MEKKIVFLLSLFVICNLICILPVAAGDDITPPTVISSYPADDSTYIPVDIDAITITFSEPIQWDTTTPPWMSVGILDWYWQVYPYMGPISVDGNTLIISNPGSPDPWFNYWIYYEDPAIPDTGWYHVDVANVKDLAGNVMEPDSYDFNFMTVPLDTTQPSVTSTYPLDSASNVPLDVTITAVMSESINQCVGTVELVDSAGSPVDLVDDCHTGTYYCTGDYINLAIQPASPLTMGETYTVTIRDMEDSYHNVMGSYSWSFTADVPPYVASVYPADGVSNIPVDVTITAVMSESINQCVGTVELVDSAGSPVDLVDDCHTGTYYCTDDYINLAIQPASPLTLGETYTVTIRDMEDSTHNVMGSYSWSFTVMTPAETTADLSAKVDELGLPPDVESGLMAKLETAEMQIEEMKYIPAEKTLIAFIKQVVSQSGKTMSTTEADELIAIAQMIIDFI